MDALNKEWETPFAGRRPDPGMGFSAVVLACGAFLTPFAMALLFWYGYGVVGRHPNVMVIVAGGVFSLLFAPAFLVGMYAIRRIFLVRYVVLFFALCGWAVIFCLIFEPGNSRQDPDPYIDLAFLLADLIFPITILIITFSIATAKFAVLRAKYFFSEKSGEWQHSYTVARGFAFDEEEPSFERLGLEDVFRADAIPIKWKSGVCSLTLYLDSISDGDHVLDVYWNRGRRWKKPFLYPFSKGLFPRKAFSITRGEAERIAEKFGPVKKTFLIVPSYDRPSVHP